MTKKHRIIVAGGRHFNDKKLAFRKLDHFLFKLDKSEVEIVEGGATGADRIGREYAISRGLAFKTFEADWDDLEAPNAVIRTNRFGKKYNAKAGNDRNLKMAEYATHLTAFWDGKSKGTKDMISTGEKLNLKVRVVRYDQN